MSRHTAAGFRQLSARTSSFGAALLAAVALVPLARAGVLLVDPVSPIGFAQIQPAIDAALPGDVILIHPLEFDAVYDPFVITGKQLALVGDISVSTPRVASSSVGDLPAGSTVMLRQLNFVGLPDTPGLVLESGAGWVRLENIDSTGGDGSATGPGAGLVIKNCNSVIVTYCHLEGGSGTPGAGSPDGAIGLDVFNTHLTQRGGSSEGGKGADGVVDVADDGGRGGDAILSSGGNVFISNVAVTGGAGGLSGCEPGGGCVCGVSGNGGDGVAMHNSVLILENNVVAGGAAPEGACAPTGSPGAAENFTGGVVQTIDSPTHDFWMSAPLQTPIPAKFHFKGVDKEAIIISAGVLPSHFFMSKFDGEMDILQSNLLDFYFLRFLDATGIHDTTHPVPAPPPGIDSFMAYTQGFFVAPGNKLYCGPLSMMIYIGYGP